MNKRLLRQIITSQDIASRDAMRNEALKMFKQKVEGHKLFKILKPEHEVLESGPGFVKTIVRHPSSYFGAAFSEKAISELKRLTALTAKKKGVDYTISVPGSKAYVEIMFKKRLKEKQARVKQKS